MYEDIVVGDRVELEHTNDEYTKLAKGTKGTVTRISHSGFTQIAIDWDDGSRLMMCPEDGDVNERWRDERQAANHTHRESSR